MPAHYSRAAAARLKKKKKPRSGGTRQPLQWWQEIVVLLREPRVQCSSIGRRGQRQRSLKFLTYNVEQGCRCHAARCTAALHWRDCEMDNRPA